MIALLDIAPDPPAAAIGTFELGAILGFCCVMTCVALAGLAVVVFVLRKSKNEPPDAG